MEIVVEGHARADLAPTFDTIVPIDLTTVQYLQQYLGEGAGTGGGGKPVAGLAALQQRLITAASKTAITTIGRNPMVAPYSETYDGTGTALLVLRNWPIVSVSQVQIFGSGWPWGGWGGCFTVQPVFPSQPQVIPVANQPNGQPGYIFDGRQGTVILVGGYCFPYGVRNVNVNYLAGFTETFPENQTITGGTVTLNNGSTWVANVAVAYAASGVLLTLITSGSPAAGQYTVSPLGVYGFSSADEADLVTVTYQFGQPPYDLQDAVCEIAAVEYRRLQHIDQDSQAMAEATTSFTRLAIPRLASMRLEQYKSKIPAM